MPGGSEPGEATTIAVGQQQAPAAPEADHTWEMSKENVMPLARGRKVDCIRRAFGDSVPSAEVEDAAGREGEDGPGFARGADPRTALLAIRSRFEPLVAEDGDDGEEPVGGDGDKLTVWWQYIQAIQDSLPNDQQEQFDLLERCSRMFLNDPRYRQDLRYLRVWTAYANYLSNADELFKFLYEKGIGGTHAHFWIGWALHAENVGKFSLAERLYSKGIIDRRAQPIDVLRKRQGHFLRRMRRKWIDSQLEDGVEDVSEIPTDEESRRNILQTLSAAAVKHNQRTKASAASQVDENGQLRGDVTGATTTDQRRNLGNRGGSGRSGSSGGGLRQGGGGVGATARRGGGGARGGRVRGGPNVGPGFAVFVEAEFERGGSRRGGRAPAAAPMDDPQEGDGWADYGTRRSRDKENVSDATRWTEGALGDRPGVPADAAPDAFTSGRARPAAPFPVYVDEQFANQEKVLPVPRREPEASAKPAGSLAGLSVRRQLDRAVGERESRAERDPFRFVKTAEAEGANGNRATRKKTAAERKVAKEREAEEEGEEEEQVEEARARWHAERQALANDTAAGSATADGHVADSAETGATQGASYPRDGGDAGRQALGEASSAGQSAAVADVIASKPSPRGAGGKIRQPMFGGEDARGHATRLGGDGKDSGGRRGEQSRQESKVVDREGSEGGGGRPIKRGGGRAFQGRQEATGVDAVGGSGVGMDAKTVHVSASTKSAAGASADCTAALTAGPSLGVGGNARRKSGFGNGNASFVGPINPREALHADQGDGEGEEEGGQGGWPGAEMGMKRRLTFGHGKAEAAARGGGDRGGGATVPSAATAPTPAAAPAAAPSPAAPPAAAPTPAAAPATAATVGAGENSAEVEEEEDDLTINTKLALEAMEDWFCSPDPDKGREEETSRQSISQGDGSGGDDSHGGGHGGGGAAVGGRGGGDGGGGSKFCSSSGGGGGGGGDGDENGRMPNDSGKEDSGSGGGDGSGIGGSDTEKGPGAEAARGVGGEREGRELGRGGAGVGGRRAREEGEGGGGGAKDTGGGGSEAGAGGGGKKEGLGGRREGGGRGGPAGGSLKPVLEARPTARFTNADLLRDFGLSSSARRAKDSPTKEKEEDEERGGRVSPVASGLSFSVYQDDDAAGSGGGEGGTGNGGGDGESVFSNGLSFAVYQDDAPAAAARGGGKEGDRGGDGASVFSNGLSFAVHQDDAGDAAAAGGGEAGGDGVDGAGEVFSNGLSFAVYQDDVDDGAAHGNGGGAGEGGGDGGSRNQDDVAAVGGGDEESVFSNGLSFAVYQDDDDKGAAAGVKSRRDVGETELAPPSAGLGFAVFRDGDNGAASSASGAGTAVPSASESSLGPGFAVYTNKGDPAAGGGGTRATAAIGGKADSKSRHGDAAVLAGGGGGLRKLEVSFFEDSVFGDAEGDDSSEETAGAASCLRFFDDSTVGSPLFETAVDSREPAVATSASKSYKRSSNADSSTGAASSSTGWTASSTGWLASSSRAPGSSRGDSDSSSRALSSSQGWAASTTGASTTRTEGVTSTRGVLTSSRGALASTRGAATSSSSVGTASSSRPASFESSGHQTSLPLPAPRGLTPSLSSSSSSGDNNRGMSSLSAKKAVAKSGNAGVSTSRKGLTVTHEAGTSNRVELSPVLEGAVINAGARQELLPPRTPRAATARGGGVRSAVGAAVGSTAAGTGASAASSAAGATAVGDGNGGGATAGVVSAAGGGVSMETPGPSTTAGRRVRGGGRGYGHGQNDADDSWSDDDGMHCGGGGRGHRISQPNGSWGGCSTIKRRADDMSDHTHGVSTGYGGRGIGVVHRGSADDDGHGNILARGFPYRSRMSSSSSSSLSGGDVSVRSTGDGVGGFGARQTPQAGWRGGGGASGGGGSARESYGRGGGGGRVDYHSLCFSSSSSGYSGCSSSPFGLLDRDSTPES